jgi:hypothetical protein
MAGNTLYRVPQHSSEEINQHIEAEMRKRLRHYAMYPAEIDQRLQELDAEWDIERTLETNAASFALGG